MKVGYNTSDYATTRNIVGLIPDVDYVKVFDFNRFITKLGRAATTLLCRQPLNDYDLRFRFNDRNLNRVDILHFFNTVSFGKTPWITTFETIIPRFQATLACHHGRNCGYSSLVHEDEVLKAVEALAGDPCKAIIALSGCNLQMQKDLLLNFPQFQAEIENKLIRMHPAQKLIVNDYAGKQLPLAGPIHFMFVGTAFFCKGGMEILEAFQELKAKKGYNLRLTIVSSMDLDDYATQKTEKDAQIAEDIIRKNSDWIIRYHRLPNQRVVELMKSAHVGLLPTFADTYGYSVLEFQACGCPVISTDVRALPEINNNEIGWMIKTPKNRLGEGIYTTKEDKAKVGLLIKEELKRLITEIMENRGVIPIKSNAALQHIKDNHSPVEFSRQLGEIYQRALE
jgi:glycosyltransferase involved in cell wall biosynthesis